jgi:hypothetical protein
MQCLHLLSLSLSLSLSVASLLGLILQPSAEILLEDV